MTSTIAGDKDSPRAHSADVALLKTDVRGRVQTPPGRRAAILAEFDRSGLSAAQFARLVGIKYSTFAAWAHKHRSAGLEAASPPPKARAPLRLIEAVVEPKTGPASRPVLIIQLPGDARMEVTHADQLPLVRALLKSLPAHAPSC